MYQISNGHKLRNIFIAISLSVLGATAPVFAQEAATQPAVEVTSEERFAATFMGCLRRAAVSLQILPAFTRIEITNRYGRITQAAFSL